MNNNYKRNLDELRQKIRLCLMYDIDIKENIGIVEVLSLREFYSKIQYLLDNNIPLTDTVGTLHEIFFLDNTDMIFKYGFSLEELISKYYSYQNHEDKNFKLH